MSETTTDETVAKAAVTSKTVWTGVALTVVSVLTLVAEFWSMLGYEQLLFLEDIFGPEMMALVGIVMVVLRVITTRPLGSIRVVTEDEYEDTF